MLSLADLRCIHDLPLPELLYRAATVHRAHHDPLDIQRCALLSVKTGGCSEDCGYCAQSAHYSTGVDSTPLLSVAEVRERAARARANGAERFCMGTAWRAPRDPDQFAQVLEMVRAVRGLGMEACVTLGMLTDAQAGQLAEAGLTAYNHNLDTSREHYGNVVSTRAYDDRLRTLHAVQSAGIGLCCGGILGMNESIDDRLRMLAELFQFSPPPTSIPINCLVPVAGTPLAQAAPVPAFELVRMVAVTRIAFPFSRVRLSAGRENMSQELQALCFFAGANSIFFGDKLLTTPNSAVDADAALFASLGITPAITV